MNNNEKNSENLENIILPNEWILYTYDKQLFKKLANKPNFQIKPYKEICNIKTMNDLVYILNLMEIKIEPQIKIGVSNIKKINLDMNDYIIMRKGIEPIWEDPKNCNGGTFTIKMPHFKGYDIWSTFIMFMLGETMTHDMNNINGITVSYISDTNNFYNSFSNNTSYTYIKIWDGKADRTIDEFVKNLPVVILNKIENDVEMRYTPNNIKKDFGGENIISKLQNKNFSFRKEKGGFNNRKKY